MCNRYTPPALLDIEREWAVGRPNPMRWWDEVTIVAKAVLVAILIFGGLLAFFAGVGEIKDSSAQKQEEEK